ncbi:conserved hypothetical protein [Pyrenophora tritici-repentis Pt-1C-BFP]|uniref:Zinc knuckle n=2 Tax=Pyrenophora tritici-repentis TaxID=45151 RepID=A0A922NS63_9PLEO|nr:uncharacterized protein PTRG_00128 [Pyrenophora tritici-repentis Pt-1C-BFP]EDU39566.1 conserved hypothetical protein [Pyrenophora tritici-repentis Pt-1C-BFP]KAI1520006.1 Zinc knuckle [Pyrenophora tritici-repentis]
MATMKKSKPASKKLTVHQLASLKTGRKANIMIGPEGNRYIAVERVSVDLLAHFSRTAHKKLIEENETILTIPNGSKKAIFWIYKYMQADQRNPQDLETFESLNSHNRIYQRLKGSLIESLPTIQEIELYQTAIPPLYQYVVQIIAGEMIKPWTCNYTAYQDLTETNKAYGKGLDEAIQKLLTAGIKRGKEYYARTKNPEVIWSKDYKNANPVPSQASGLSNTKAKHHDAAKNASSVQGTTSQVPFMCYKCHGEGHLARNCTVKLEPKPANCYKCNEPGHIARNCTKVPSARVNKPITCYNCGECTLPNRRRVVPVIQVSDFGGGLQTCDRVVRKGELSRTGMRI